MVAQNYARLYRSNSVLTATPGQLVLILFDGALTAVGIAREAFQRPASDFRRFETINTQLLKAQRILLELKGTLKFDVGGDFAPLMERLYEYYIRRLREANIAKQPEPLTEVEDLLRQIRNAWAEMLRSEASGSASSASASLNGAAVPA
jgi:flagellar secretion chaperone FliS